MTDAWNQAAGMADKHTNSSGLFVRLTGDGDKIVGAFCGDPLAREVVWNGERYETFDSDIHHGKKPSLRVSINFFVPAENDIKVIEGGTVWFKDLLKVRDKYGLENWLFEIERHGEAGNPKTKYTILPEKKLTAEQIEVIAGFDLHDLKSLVEGGSGDDPPIDAETAAQFVTRLKALPRSDVDTFLSQFKVQRVRDLRQSDVEPANHLLGALEARSRRQTQQAEIDPFA
jgi:hypothetical protein